MKQLTDRQAVETLTAREQYEWPEISAPSDYHAVPLNAWSARDKYEDRPYSTASMDRIQERVGLVCEQARTGGWADGELHEHLQQLIELSLIDSELQRIDRNAQVSERFGKKWLGRSDERVDRARIGAASPYDLMGILLDNPDLGSIELAKLYHPLSASATTAMEADIHRMLNLCAPLPHLAEEPRYKSKTVIGDMPAATVLRKQQVASIPTRSGTIAVVRRQSFLVRGDTAAADELQDPYLHYSITRAKRREKLLFPMIEDFIPHLPELPHLKWLQPLATSYYAKNLSTVKNPRDETKKVVRLGE